MAPSYPGPLLQGHFFLASHFAFAFLPYASAAKPACLLSEFVGQIVCSTCNVPLALCDMEKKKHSSPLVGPSRTPCRFSCIKKTSPFSNHPVRQISRPSPQTEYASKVNKERALSMIVLSMGVKIDSGGREDSGRPIARYRHGLASKFAQPCV